MAERGVWVSGVADILLVVGDDVGDGGLNKMSGLRGGLEEWAASGLED
jgi:hypothetical protein